MTLFLIKGNQEYSKSLTRGCSIVRWTPLHDHSQRSSYGTFVRMGTHFPYVKRTGSSGPSDKPQYAIMMHLLCGSQYTAVRLP